MADSPVNVGIIVTVNNARALASLRQVSDALSGLKQTAKDTGKAFQDALDKAARTSGGGGGRSSSGGGSSSTSSDSAPVNLPVVVNAAGAVAAVNSITGAMVALRGSAIATGAALTDVVSVQAMSRLAAFGSMLEAIQLRIATMRGAGGGGGGALPPGGSGTGSGGFRALPPPTINYGGLAAYAGGGGVGGVIPPIGGGPGGAGGAGGSGFFSAAAGAARSLGTVISDLELKLTNIAKVLGFSVAAAAVAAGKSFIDLTQDMERVIVRLSIFEGSFDAAYAKLGQLTNLAAQSPFGLGNLTSAFVRLKAAGIDPLTGSDGKSGPLVALNNAVAAFGGNQDSFNRTILAIEQMSGKGVIQMEELRQQLAEHLPTAAKLMAEGMGVSLAKLTIMISKGELDAETGLNALFGKLQEKYGGAAELLSKTLGGTIAQLKTQFDQLAITFVKSGGNDAIAAVLRVIVEAFKELNQQLSSGGMSAAIDNFFGFFSRNADSVARVVNTLENFGTILLNVGQSILGFLNILPPEAAAGGVIGFMMFGRAGFVAGALIGEFSDVLAGVAARLAGFVGVLNAVAGTIGTDIKTLATFGLVGFMIYGKTGALVAITATVVDGILGGVLQLIAEVTAQLFSWGATATAFAHHLATELSFDKAIEAAKKAGNDAKQAFLDGITTAPDGSKYNLNATPLTNLTNATFGGSGATNTASDVQALVDKIKEYIKQAGDARKATEGMFGTPDDIAGPNVAQQKKIQAFEQKLQQLNAKLQGAESNNPLAALVANKQNDIAGMNTVISQMTDKMNQFLSQGKVKQAEEMRQSIADLKTETASYAGVLGQLIAINDKKEFQELSDKLQTVHDRIAELGDKSMDSVAAAVDRVNKQFDPLVAQLHKIEESGKKILGDEDARQKIIGAARLEEERLAVAKEKAIAQAKQLAEIENSIRKIQASRAVNQFKDSAEQQGFSNTYNDLGGQLAQVRSQFRNTFEDIDLQVAEFQKQITLHPELQEEYMGYIMRLREVKQAYEGLQGGALERVMYQTSEIGKLFQSVGDTIEKSMVDSLDAVIMKTGAVHDVLVSMYGDLRKAAEQYLVKFLEMQMFGNSAGIGANLFGMAGGSAAASAEAGMNSSVGGGGGWMGTAASWIGSFFTAAANGASFASPIVAKFGSGGVVNGPTMFGVAGEVPGHPEAILPLHKIGGKLGVAAVGAGGGDNYQISISAVDAQGVAALFYEHGSALVSSLQMRSRLNRGTDRVR
jgi:tape measure domain-containing protein